MQRNRYHHLEWLNGIDFFEAAFSTQTFTRHAHEGFAIGAIAEGAGGYLCRGESMVLPAGSLSLMNPEEAHTGHAAAERVRYNMLYASEAAVRAVLGLRTLRGFAEIAPRDRDFRLSQALTRLAECLNSPQMADYRPRRGRGRPYRAGRSLCPLRTRRAAPTGKRTRRDTRDARFYRGWRCRWRGAEPARHGGSRRPEPVLSYSQHRAPPPV